MISCENLRIITVIQIAIQLPVVVLSEFGTCTIKEPYSEGSYEENKQLKGFVLGHVKAYTKTQCAKVCLSVKNCQSFNYNNKKAQCELSNDTISSRPDSLITDEETIYSETSTWDTDLVGQCAKKPCADNNICLENESSFTCKPVAQCGAPELIDGATFKYMSVSPGAHAIYKCHAYNNSAKIADNCPVSTCLKSENWSKATFSCQSKDCIKTSSKLYMGTISCTVKGTTCQRWDQNTPHKHSSNIWNFPDFEMEEINNYCRDPDKTGQPWCYTMDPNKRWDLCPAIKC